MAMTQPQINFCETYLSNGYNALMHLLLSQMLIKPIAALLILILLKKPEIKEYIEKRREEIYESLNIDANRIAYEIASVAFADKGDDLYSNAKLKSIRIITKRNNLVFKIKNLKLNKKLLRLA